MIQINDKQNCCGCEACAQVCPKKCISMKRDAEGFLYPQANETICINCGLCEKVCPVINQYETRQPNRILAAINKDEEIRSQSSSGGIFTLLAEQTISKGGVVFGARFDEEWQVEIACAETMDQVASFRGSKYLQARVGDSYRQCKKALEDGRDVMFCGTPCQIAALRLYLHKPYEKLLTVDFICHGVPSPGVWRKYLDEVVAAGQQAIHDIDFRNKTKGWKRFSFILTIKEGNGMVSILSPLDKNPYMRAFLNDLILRPSCYQCPAKGGKSYSDITIADFWGVQNVNPSMDDDKGTSLVLANTEKGASAIPYDSLYYEVSTEDALKYNSAYYKATMMNPRRSDFFASFERGENLHLIIEQALRPSAKQRFKHLLKTPIQSAKKCIKTVLGRGSKPINGGGNYDNLRIQVQKASFKPCSIAFRDKRNGWKHYMLRIDMTILDGE